MLPITVWFQLHCQLSYNMVDNTPDKIIFMVIKQQSNNQQSNNSTTAQQHKQLNNTTKIRDTCKDTDIIKIINTKAGINRLK